MTDLPNLQEQLAAHIKRNLSKGYTEDALKFSLVKQGYSRTAIENAIKIANRQLAAEAPKMTEKPQITVKTLGDGEVVNVEPTFFQKIWRKIFG